MHRGAGSRWKPQKRMRTNPRGKCVEQEPPQKLLGGHGHQPLLAVVGIVFPAER